MSKVLIIGAGGVGQVVTHKCAQRRDIFTEITLASRTKSKCDAIAAQIATPVKTAQVDADNVPELVALIKQEQPKLVINVALPYQDLTIMDACLATGVDYLDTANYEPLDTAKFEYSLAVGLPGALQGKGADGAARLRLRSGRDQRLHRPGRQEVPGRGGGDRHHRRQRRQPRPALCHQLQPGDQHPRGDRHLPSLGERPVGREPGALHQARPSTSPRGSGR